MPLGEVMKRVVAVLGSVAALLLTACPSPSAIGGPCGSSSECQSDLSCATNYPAGYCFKDCTGQGSRVCGSGNACVRIGGASTAECYDECDTNSGCRSGYECVTVSNLPGSYAGVCLPK
jgi:hypothetical protein